jgi:hypothetical protein
MSWDIHKYLQDAALENIEKIGIYNILRSKSAQKRRKFPNYHRLWTEMVIATTTWNCSGAFIKALHRIVLSEIILKALTYMNTVGELVAKFLITQFPNKKL